MNYTVRKRNIEVLLRDKGVKVLSDNYNLQTRA